MRCRWSVLFSLGMLLLASLEAFGIRLGMTVEEVERSLGPPNGMRQLADGQVWVYANGIFVEFTNGRVSRLRGIDTGIDNEIPQAVPAPEAPLPAATSEPATGGGGGGASDTEQVEPPSGQGVAQPASPDPGPSPPEESTADEQVPLNDPETATEKAQELWGDQSAYDPEAYEDRPGWQVELIRIGTGFFLPVILTAIFLMVAFHWVGAIADKWAILLIALIDRIVVLSVEFLFLTVLAFPTTFYAQHLASIVVMVPLVISLTHAKELPTALQVVITSKVAGMITFWLLLMVLLHVM